MDLIDKLYRIDDSNVDKEINDICARQKSGFYPMSFDMPTVVQLELTTDCNLKCRHCYNRSNERVFPRTLTADDWKRVATDIVLNGGVFEVILSGGEPLLLGDHLFDIMDIFAEDGSSFVIISNGMLLKEEIAKKFLNYRFYWTQISIDGYNAEYHDYFRGVKGSHQKACNAAYYLSKNGLPLKIAHCVTNENKKDLEKMVKLAYQLGASAIILGENMKSGRAAKNDDTLMFEDEKNELYERIQELQILYSDKIKVERSANLKCQLKSGMSTPATGVVLRPNGDVRLDCVAPFVIGNLFDHSLSKIWKEKHKDCWKHPKVKEYYNSIDYRTNESNMIINYLDNDFVI